MSKMSRVSIPNNVRQTIQNIKEIAKNHSDEEIYAMLKECSMDPNETAQKLLHQDTFHEVRRKRDKKKENLSTKETADPRWRPGTQGRGGRGGRGIYSPRYVSHDAGSGRNVTAGNENGVNQRAESGATSLPASQEAENKGIIPVASSLIGATNGPTTIGSSGQGPAYSPEKPTNAGVHKLGSNLPAPPPSVQAKSSTSTGGNITHGKHTPSSDHSASPVSVLGVYSSASDPVLVPSLDSRLPGTVGTIKREVGSQRTVMDTKSSISTERKSTAIQDFTKRLPVNKVVSRNVTNSELSPSMNEKAPPEIGNSVIHGKLLSRPQGFDKNQLPESLHSLPSSTQGGTSSSRPSSNYGNRSQQLSGSQKVGPSKEWKPKPIIPNSAPAVVTSEVGPPITVEAGDFLAPKSDVSGSGEAKSKLQHEVEELQISQSQYVIIPNHLQVPKSERTGLSFGSFDPNFGVDTNYVDVPESEKSSAPPSESFQEVEEAAEEPCSSNHNSSPNAQNGEYLDHPQSPRNVLENLSPVEADVPSSAVLEYEQSKSDTVLPIGGSQYPVVQATPSYSFGLISPLLGTQFASFDSSEPQARDMPRIPSYVVPPTFDPSSYYTQFIRPGADGDGRFSPFLAPGATTKYNGNVAVISPQSGQLPQESGNSLVPSTASPTPVATQAAGAIQSSLAVTQQPIPVYRQPTGVHLPHYPPNYIPYSHYIPFYVPPPTLQHFVSNPAFPQQPPPGSIYSPAQAAAPGVKFPLPQFKPGTNTGNSMHGGTPTAYAPYNSTPAGYSPNPTANAGNSTGNEDLSASQFKENGVYIPGQQSEGGSGVWISTPGREVSGLQGNSFYNMSPHIAFTPTQAGHAGTFGGIYHPAQTVPATAVHPLLQQSQTMAGPVEIVGPPAGIYQQTQRNPMNWSNSY